MSEKFDEISLKYWNDNKEKTKSSKSYICIHNGYVYGDNMKFDSIQYVYISENRERIIHAEYNRPKSAYFALVEEACNMSETTFNNFLNNKAEKFRVYSADQVKGFTSSKRKSTRIVDNKSLIQVHGADYYVANNLKICEYFNSASMNIDSEELHKWYIRIYFDDKEVQQMQDIDEAEDIDAIENNFTLTIHPVSYVTSHNMNNIIKSFNVDFQITGKQRKNIGRFGNVIILEYERKRLIDLGLSRLSSKIKYPAETRGNALGYDIISYDMNGKPIYIKVKTTKQNKPADFYISTKEKSIAEQMFERGNKYLLYRIFNLNPRLGIGDLIVYEYPISRDCFDMYPENWKISAKE